MSAENLVQLTAVPGDVHVQVGTLMTASPHCPSRADEWLSCVSRRGGQWGGGDWSRRAQDEGVDLNWPLAHWSRGGDFSAGRGRRQEAGVASGLASCVLGVGFKVPVNVNFNMWCGVGWVGDQPGRMQCGPKRWTDSWLRSRVELQPREPACEERGRRREGGWVGLAA